MASLKKRGDIFYIQYYVGNTQRRVSTGTNSYQLAKDKLRQFESAQLRGIDSPLPTRTPIAQIVGEYVRHIRTTKTAKSAQTDVYYLRDVFGTVCPELEVTSRKTTAKKRPRKNCDADRRCHPPMLEAGSFEAITTTDVSTFIASQVRSRGLAPKTANRYREILHRLFAWAMKERGVRMPAGINPVGDVERYKERAPEIRFLTLAQIDEQLHALRSKPQLQTMVAVLIYAGLRREELLWLTTEDVDLQAGTRGLLRVRAKTINGESWQPKTKVNRAVPISQALRRHLDAYTCRPSDAGWFFASPTGRRWDADNFSAELRAANETAGLVWGCLDYRHTFGSQLAQAGRSLYQIATLLGNSPEICRRHYACMDAQRLMQAVEFGALFFS